MAPHERHAVVYTTAQHPRWQGLAARGGPGGEIRMVGALLAGLERLGVRTTTPPTLRRFALHRLTGGVPRGARVTLFLDPPTLELACRWRLLGPRDAARVRVLEWFGTPPGRVSRALPGLTAAQYLLPHPDPRWNGFLGYLLEDAAGAPIPDAAAFAAHARAGLAAAAPRGVVWGKEARYLAGPAGAQVAELAREHPLHATIAPAEGGGGGALPDGIIDHGLLGPAAWRALLRESDFVVGTGDPVLGPTALEALAAGCVYLDPVQPRGRTINGIPELAIDAQHPYAVRAGPPFVLRWDPSVPGSLVAAVDAALSPESRAARLAALGDDGPLVRALAPFTLGPYLERLEAALA